jgi:hypothetical protein
MTNDYAQCQRPMTPRRPVGQLENSFEEVETGFVTNETMAQNEARRCLRCDLEWVEAMKAKG